MADYKLVNKSADAAGDTEVPKVKKYLLCDGDGVYYRLSHDGTPEAIEAANPDSQLFLEYGFSDLPESTVLMQLKNPTILYWQDLQDELPILKARLKAVPPPQTVYSKDNVMTDSTVFGIEKVEIDADETALFAFSFDGGQTWKAYLDGRWGLLSEESSGMGRETVEEIGADAWAEAVTENRYMVRFTVFEGGYVNRIIIHYVN